MQLMKIFGGFFSAYMVVPSYSGSQVNTRQIAVTITRNSKEEAVKSLLLMCFDTFPVEQGWTGHIADVVEVTQEQLMTVEGFHARYT